jgi:FtsZ-binding cell division protein ZapB
VEGEGIGVELIRVIRKISQCRQRLQAIELEIEALVETELYQLQSQVVTAKKDGRDLLAEMAQHLDEQIAEAQARLSDLKKKMEM